MGDRKITHVGDIFGGGRQATEEWAPTKPRNIMDRKTSFNYKNKRAPQPPGNLPQIGNYQPKMLLKPKLHSHVESHDQNNRRSQPAGGNQSQADVISRSPPRAMVIGDKDVPLCIERASDSEQQFLSPVAPPRRKRRAPSAPDAAAADSVNQRNNPIFGRSISQRSDEEPFSMPDFEEHGGDIDFASGIDNPAFHSRSRTTSGSSYLNSHEHKYEHRDHPGGNHQSDHLDARRQGSDVEASRVREDKYSHVNMPRSAGDPVEYPYIPPPDYQDEEVTMDFHGEKEAFLGGPHAQNQNNFNREPSNYRKLEGDDFGQYLEDEYELDRPGQRSGRMANGYRSKGKSAQKHKSNNKDQKHKKKHSKNDAKRNTIRDFAYSDSKIGWGDRTVKSTSAKGRYIKRERDRKRIDTSEARVPSGTHGGSGSYEEFLKVRNGLPLDSPNSSDSGVELADDPPNVDMYIHSQPKQMKYRKYDEKPNLLQRLTWRFRKMNFSRGRHEFSPEPQILSERL